MVDQKQVSVCILLSWVGAVFATAVLTLNLIHYVPGLGFVGLAVVVITCTHIVRCTLLKRDRMLREAFELGRDHERLQSVRAVR
jgi:cell division protein FtsL